MNQKSTKSGLVVCSDLHLGFHSHKYAIRRYKSFEAMVQFVLKNNIGTFVINGDVLDNRPPQNQVLEEWFWLEKQLQILQSAGVQVVVIIGNHDRETDLLSLLQPYIVNKHSFSMDGVVCVHGDMLATRFLQKAIKNNQTDVLQYIEANPELELELIRLDEINRWIFIIGRKFERITVKFISWYSKILTTYVYTKVITARAGLSGFLRSIPLFKRYKTDDVRQAIANTVDHYSMEHGFQLAELVGAKALLLGHTHRAGLWMRKGILIANSGCFTTLYRPSFLEVNDNKVHLHEWNKKTNTWSVSKSKTLK